MRIERRHASFKKKKKKIWKKYIQGNDTPTYIFFYLVPPPYFPSFRNSQQTRGVKWHRKENFAKSTFYNGRSLSTIWAVARDMYGIRTFLATKSRFVENTFEGRKKKEKEKYVESFFLHPFPLSILVTMIRMKEIRTRLFTVLQEMLPTHSYSHYGIQLWYKRF